eukprot:s275_g32.t3
MSLSDMKKFSSFVAEGSEALQSELVQEELKTLTTEHQALISLSVLGKWDTSSSGVEPCCTHDTPSDWQLADTARHIQYMLSEELNPDFLEESQRYLMQVGMTVEQFNTVIQDVLEMALHVLSMNGIRFSAEEINELVQTEETGTTSSAWHNGDWMRHSQEEVMIYEVVDRMPEGLRDGFEHLTLELLVVVTTAARMRTWILWNPVASNVVNSMINHPIEQP